MRVLGTVRFRLAMWNVCVLAVVLAIFGYALRLKVQTDLLSEVDTALSQSAIRAQKAGESPNTFTLFLYRRGLTNGSQNGTTTPTSVASPTTGTPSVYSVTGPPAGYWESLIDVLGEPMYPDHPIIDTRAVVHALTGKTVYTTAEFDGQRVRVITAPIFRNDRLLCLIQFTRPLAPVTLEVNRITRGLLTLIPLALLIVGVGALLLTERALRPVREIVHATEGIEASDLTGRLRERGSDEFSHLASTINNMLGRLDKAFKLLQEASDQQRRFTADASHELRTPLTIIKANTSLALSSERTPAEYRKTIDAVDRAADRMGKIVQDLLYIARSDAGQLFLRSDCVSLESVVRQSIEAIADVKGHTIRYDDLAAGLKTPGDEDALVRLFTNLLQNASNYTPAGGLITVSSYKKSGWNYIKVADTGIGIAREHIEHLGERFFRVDDGRARDDGGTGLGLAICRTIVEAHGGSLTIESKVGVGTKVTVKLPMVDARKAGQVLVEAAGGR